MISQRDFNDDTVITADIPWECVCDAYAIAVFDDGEIVIEQRHEGTLVTGDPIVGSVYLNVDQVKPFIATLLAARKFSKALDLEEEEDDQPA